jgi:homoserine dehydrogenase
MADLKPEKPTTTRKETTMKAKKVGVIGCGSVGGHLAERLQELGHDVCFKTRSTHDGVIYSDRIQEHRPDAVFLCIPSNDRGDQAHWYLKHAAQIGIPVITCEKGGLAYHAKDLRQYMDKIGFSAVVGGGTMMLQYLRMRNPNHHPLEIRAVLNGSINFLCGFMSRGKGLGEACLAAADRHLLEPGSNDPVSVFTGELRDALLKSCITYETCLAEGDWHITPDSFAVQEVTSTLLDTLSRGPSCRFVVTITNRSKPIQDPRLLTTMFCLREQINGWSISGDFIEIDDSDAYDWLPHEENNAFRIAEGDYGNNGIYVLGGPGAGRRPTATAMIHDFIRLCGDKK